MDKKSIDINQRIPLDTLYIALECYLNDNYSNEYISEQLRFEFDGENRLKKALKIVNKIIKRNPINDFVLKNRLELISAIKNKSDRQIIIISLLNSAYPFSFEVLKTFARLFSVQDIVSSETIKKTISNIYGGNRATENGLYSVIPMFIEAGLFTRSKSGIYERLHKTVNFSDIASAFYIESFKANCSIVEIQDYHLRDPYFIFINQY